MADQQGPSLNIPFDSRNLEQLKRYQDAAKNARRELKALKKEMEEATAQGRAIDRKAIDRLRTLENIERKATEVVRAEKEGAVARREALRVAREERAELQRQTSTLTRAGKLTRKLAMSPAVHRILAGGDLDFRDARLLADPFLMEGASRGIRRAGVQFGSRALGAAGRGLGAVAASPAAMLALHVTIDRVQKIISETKSIRKAQERVTDQVASGQISRAEARLFDQKMDEFQATGDKGESAAALLEGVQRAAGNIREKKLTGHEIAQAVKDAAKDVSAGTVMKLAEDFKNGKIRFDPKTLQKAIDDGVRAKSLKLGRALTGDEEKRAVNEALATNLADLPPEFIEKFTQKLNEVAEKKKDFKPIRELSGQQILDERFQGDLENFNNFQRAQKEMEKLGAGRFIPGTTQVQGRAGTPAKSSPVVASAAQAAEDEKQGTLNARDQHLVWLLKRDGFDD